MRQTRTLKNAKAISLVEILVVVAIIALLVGLSIPAINFAWQRVNQALEKPDEFPDAGLIVTSVSGNLNTTAVNDGGLGIDPLGPSLSEARGTWGGNTTYIYTGLFYDEDGEVSFWENIDDKIRLQIDGVTLLNNGCWNCVTTYDGNIGMGNINNSPGWHEFELRMSNGGGGSANQANANLGFGINVDGNGQNNTDWTLYDHPQNAGGDWSMFLAMSKTDAEAKYPDGIPRLEDMKKGGEIGAYQAHQDQVLFNVEKKLYK